MRRLTPKQSPWEGLQFTNFDQCLHIVMVIGKCTDALRGIFLVGGGVMWGYLSMEEFVMEEENFHKGGVGFFSILK